ncbi:uncharacterized protein V6R79_007202 [Siganus canaliculatus]
MSERLLQPQPLMTTVLQRQCNDDKDDEDDEDDDEDEDDEDDEDDDEDDEDDESCETHATITFRSRRQKQFMAVVNLHGFSGMDLRLAAAFNRWIQTLFGIYVCDLTSCRSTERV